MPSVLQDHVAGEIRAQLARRRITQAQLAAALNRSHAWISYRLNGKQPIDLHDLEQIAAAIGASVDELLPLKAAA